MRRHAAARRTRGHGHTRGGLTPRLRKRPDTAVAKLAARPAHRDGSTGTIEADGAAGLRLPAPGGVVVRARNITCGRLLAPACVHRAAAACAARLAEPHRRLPQTPHRQPRGGLSASVLDRVYELGAGSRGERRPVPRAFGRVPGAHPRDPG
ncbi:hypothetical protein ACFYT7_21390 [Streptomyces sp. NPDC004041]|uniref:hypothetical protein n=1 Tax=Streptomyces sp. NPDC004041 TaxID=3364688 RepID=UPI00368D341B